MRSFMWAELTWAKLVLGGVVLSGDIDSYQFFSSQIKNILLCHVELTTS